MGRPLSGSTGPQHCDTAVQLSDETLLLEQAHRESERLQVLHPESSGDGTVWVWQGPDHWIGLTSVTDSDGRIKLGGETWSARLAAGTTTTVGPGEEVRVIAIQGATAIVSPVPPTDHPAAGGFTATDPKT